MPRQSLYKDIMASLVWQPNVGPSVVYIAQVFVRVNTQSIQHHMYSVAAAFWTICFHVMSITTPLPQAPFRYMLVMRLQYFGNVLGI